MNERPAFQDGSLVWDPALGEANMRIIIADDHPLFRTALSHAVTKVWSSAEVVEASSAAQARTELEGGAEALLLDLHMEDSSGLSVLMDLRQDFPALPIVIVSASEEPRVYAAAEQLGAAGFIPKSSGLDEMRASLSAVRDGDTAFPENDAGSDDDLTRMASLTPAQRRILGSIRQGLLNKQIAYEQDISEATVKAHITAIFRKLGVSNRTQAVLLAAKLDVDQPATDAVGACRSLRTGGVERCAKQVEINARRAAGDDGLSRRLASIATAANSVSSLSSAVSNIAGG